MLAANGQQRKRKDPIYTKNDNVDPRLEELIHWLDQVPGFAGVELWPASVDASFRRYFRVQSGGQTRIVMDAPPPQEDCRPFVQIAGILRAMGLNAPEVLQADLEQGFLLMSDLGQRQYLDELEERPAAADNLYQDAINALRLMQIKGKPVEDSLSLYDESLLRSEVALFRDWLCAHHLGLNFSSEDAQRWSDCCDVLIANAMAQPQSFVHRDYHSRNLMLVDGNNPGILDFQDAVLGPFTYDLVSLLRDCYVRWPQEQVRDWALSFHSMLASATRHEVSSELFLRYFDLTGIHRHLKAAGIFARLLHRDGKPGYMGDVPRTLQYIVDAGRNYPEMHFLVELIETRCLPALAVNQ